MNLLAVRILLSAYVASCGMLAGTPGWSRVSLVLACLLAAALVTRPLVRRELVLPKLTGLVMAFVGYLCASILWSQWDASLAIWQVLSAIIGGLAVWCALANGAGLRCIAWGGTVGALALLISLQMEAATGQSRAAGLLGNANSAALYLAFVGLVALFQRPRLTYASVLVSLACVSGAFLWTGSRRGLIAVLAVAVAVLVRALFDRSRAVRWTVGLGALVLPLLLLLPASIGRLGNVIVVQRLIEGHDEASLQIRDAMADEAYLLWIERPIIGHGEAQFQYRSSFGTYSHRNYLELLANLGVVGFALYYSLHLSFLLCAVRNWRHDRLGCALLLILLLSILAYDIWSVSYNSKTGWLMLATAAYLSSKVQRASRQRGPGPVAW